MLALDQCNVLEYSLHDQWVEKVFDVRTETPTDGYSHNSLQKVIQPDRKLFLQLAELTREGIQVKHDGRPCDEIFLQATQHPDVLHLLQPLPVARVSKAVPTIEVIRDGPYHKGVGKGKKGKSKSSTFTGSPLRRLQVYRHLGILTTNVNVGMVAVCSFQGLCLSFVPDFNHCLLINIVKEGEMGTWSRL